MNINNHTNHLDKMFGLLFIILSILGLYFSTIITNVYTVLLPLSIFTGAFIYIIFRRNMTVYFGVKNYIDMRIIATMYFCLVSILFIFYSHVAISRANIVLLSSVGIVLFTYVCVSRTDIKRTGLLLVIMSSVVINYTIFNSGVLYIGQDIYTHVSSIESILETSSIEPLSDSRYYYSALYFISIALFSEIANVEAIQSTYLIVSIPSSVLLALGAYLIGKLFWNYEVGLYSAFILSFGNYSIYWAVQSIPNTYGIILFPLFLFVTIRFFESGGKKHFILYVMLLFSIGLFHQASLFIICVAVLSFIFGGIIIKGIKDTNNISFFIFPICTIALFFSFTQHRGPSGDATLLDWVLTVLINNLILRDTQPGTTVSLPENTELTVAGAAALDVVQIAGSAFLLAMAIIGSLIWIRDDISGIAFGFPTFVLFAFAFIGPIFGIRTLLPTRWFIFIYVFLSVFSAVFILTLEKLVDDLGNHSKGAFILLILVIILPYIVFMGGSHVGSPNDPIFDSPAAERLSIGETESIMFSHLSTYHSTNYNIYADGVANPPLNHHYQVPTNRIVIDHNDPNSINKPALLVDRAYLRGSSARYSVRYQSSTFRVHGPFPVGELDNKTKIYTNGDENLILV